MISDTIASTSSDPLRIVGDALDTAVQTTREGVEKARATASDAIPAVGQFLSQVAYKTCYGISFGIVYPTMLIVSLIPKNNAVVHGFIDGAHAAMDSVNEMKFR